MVLINNTFVIVVTSSVVNFTGVKKDECRSTDYEPFQSSDQNGNQFSSVPVDVREEAAKTLSRDRKYQTATCVDYCIKYYVTFTNGMEKALNLIRCRTGGELRTFWVRKNADREHNYRVYYETRSFDDEYDAYLARRAFQELQKQMGSITLGEESHSH